MHLFSIFTRCGEIEEEDQKKENSSEDISFLMAAASIAACIN
jgi:hypothetical protein